MGRSATNGVNLPSWLGLGVVVVQFAVVAGVYFAEVKSAVEDVGNLKKVVIGDEWDEESQEKSILYQSKSVYEAVFDVENGLSAISSNAQGANSGVMELHLKIDEQVIPFLLDDETAQIISDLQSDVIRLTNDNSRLQEFESSAQDRFSKLQSELDNLSNAISSLSDITDKDRDAIQGLLQEIIDNFDAN